MIPALRSLLQGRPRFAPSRIDRLTYAIGDIHGCDDLFAGMLEKIHKDCLALAERPRLILLGDYIDRGPASRQVIDRVLALKASGWCDVEVLMGNHEEAVIRFLGDPGYGVAWAEYGGASTLASYGVSLPRLRSDPESWVAVRNEFVEVVPKSHLKLFSEMEIIVSHGDYLFVHAGVRPGRPLCEQGGETFMWIRDDFLSAEKSCEYVVVHGHTPVTSPFESRWRIGVDTGAYATGVLTAVRLVGEARSLLSISRE